ncbi:MAG TPA: M28 family metallopeptidase [Gemmatimonadaceae bacterium]|nr:M28 family metallopeptidase [Gemmatimonadaceae bacterium]
MTRSLAALGTAAVACAAIAACSSRTSSSTSAASPAAVDAAAHAINDTSLLQHIKDLSADSMEGRAPGTTGEQKAVAYMQGQFEALGLAPGNPDGTYLQNVDLIGYMAHPTASFTAKGKTVALKYPDDYIANSRHNRPETDIDNSDVVFVGYGVVAPEYGWDDYKGVDVKGKTILMLVNDPPVRAPNDTALDTTMFKGRAMTYYGRWTYKYEIASDKGAAAAIIIHETGPAGYPYDVVKSSNSQEQFDVITPDADKRVAVEGWITLDKAKELLKDAGQNFDALKAAAARKDFKPVTLDAKATFHVKIDARKVQSHNVVAKLEGGDKKDEYIIYTAHWDHLGIGPKVNGDSIYNGAADNASGSSALLEIAKAYKKLPTPPRRSILFLSVTAEEKGLLGAKYYATHPLYPLAKTAADINMDGVNQWGRTSDFTVIGLGNSTLDDVLSNVLTADGRTVRPDAEPEKGFYYRSDHFEFAKQGVPALDPDAGVTFIGKPANYGIQKRDEYTTKDYHQPSDEVKPDWDLSGAVEDLRVLFKVGDTVANADALPTWKPGTEFKAKRDSMLAAAK